MRKTYLVEVVVNTGDGVDLLNSAGRNILRNRLNGKIGAATLLGDFPRGVTISVEEINIKEDPYVTDQAKRYEQMEADLAMANRTVKQRNVRISTLSAQVGLQATKIRDLERQLIEREIVTTDEGDVRQDVSAIHRYHLPADADQPEQEGRMTTRNPYGSDANYGRSLAWDEGYTAGKNDDSERLADAYDKGVAHTIGRDVVQHHRILALEDQVLNLQEKNDNQRDIIVEAGEQHDINAYQLVQWAKRNRNQRDIIDSQEIELKRLRQQDLAAVKDLQNDSYNSGFAAGQGSLEGLGSVGYDTGKIEGFESGHREGFDKGLAAGRDEGNPNVLGPVRDPVWTYRNQVVNDANKEGWDAGYKEGLNAPMDNTNQYKVGFEEGQKRALEDWIMHFILYMQENEHSFAVVKLSQLESMREAINKVREQGNISDEVVYEAITLIDTILVRLEHL